MAKVSEKVQEAIFNQLLSMPANSECADCRTTQPTWVSLDFGVFLCMRCSGVHRQIGPHITRVRSVRLDGWTKENIEIMATVGNKVANDYYENSTSGYSRKPGSNSSPEECRRYVDDKYIHKKFAVQGYQDPVKELLAARAKGTKPDYSYSTQAPTQQQQQQQQPQKAELHPRTHSHEAPHVNSSLRKKSLSLDKFPRDVTNSNTKVHQHHDLLSNDDDLLGGDAPTQSQGQSNQSHSHSHAHAHSASPAKINFAKFKKGNSQPPSQETPATTQWTVDLVGNLNQNQNQNQQQNQNQNQNQNNNQNNGANNLLNLYNNNNNSQQQQQQQQQSQQPIDLKQLYNQGGHQNHFMQGNSRQNWGSQGMHQQNFQGGFNGGYNMGMNQGGGQYNQGFGMQQGYNQHNQQMGGFNPQQQQQQMNNFGGNMGGQQMGYNQGYGQNQGQNQYQNNGFVQVNNTNKYF